MKKISIILAIVLAISATNVSAMKMDISQKDCKVTVNIDIEKNKKSVAVLLSGIDENKNIIYLDDNYTNSKGLYSCSFDANKTQGILTVSANVIGEGLIRKNIIIRTKTIEDELIEFVNKAGATKEELKQKVEYYWDGLELTDTILKSLANKDNVYQIIINDAKLTKISSYEEFKNCYNRACLTQKYNELANKNEINNYLVNDKDAAGELFSECFNGLNEKVKAQIESDMKQQYQNSSEFMEDIEFSLLKNCIKFSPLWSDIKSVLQAYSEKVKLTRTVTNDDCKKIIGNNYNSYEDVLKALSETNDTISNTGNSNKSSGGGGGGIIIAPSPSTDIAVAEQATKNSKSIFSDMENFKWAESYVEHIYNLGIVSGTGDGKFCPEKNVSRAEATKMFVGLIKNGVSAETTQMAFKDVKKEDWFYPYISFAFNNNIIKGYSKDYFGANQNVTRQEAAVMALNVVQYLGLNKDKRLSFIDADKIAPWAKDAVEIMGGIGIIHGRTSDDGFRFDPDLAMTRAEMAVIISNIADLATQ